MGVLMNQRYRARRKLYYCTGNGVIARIMNGELVKWADRGIKEAEAGAIVTDLPKPSIPVLLKKGWIEPVAATAGAQEGGDA